jgi:4,5-DOPA dioxygenase extradiol
MTSLKDLDRLGDTFSRTEKYPALFLGHGSPMNAIEENQFVKGFRTISKTLPKPKSILCVSAHWFTRGTRITAMENPRTIHDFGGFPDELYEVQYPAKGDPFLAEEAKNLLLPEPVELDHEWGLDHGAWSVIKHLYPDADIPIIQMSIDFTKPAQYHFELSQKLKKLRHRGVLIIGSGNIVHNLRLVDWQNFDKDNHGHDWAIEAREILNKHILEGNFKALVEYEKLSTAIQMAIPTPDHYLPLIYTLGLKENNETLSLFNDKLVAGSLSMTSVKIT